MFRGGSNIALKIPKSKYDKTLSFYRDILKFEIEEVEIDNPTVSKTHKLKFGSSILWLDCVDNYTHSETWLELETPNIHKAMDYLNKNDVHPCDELEQIPDNKHWIMDPSGTVFIIGNEES